MHATVFFDEKVARTQRRSTKFWTRGGRLIPSICDGAVSRDEEIAFPTTRRCDSPNNASDLVVCASVRILSEPQRETEQVRVCPNDYEGQRNQVRMLKCFFVYPVEKVSKPVCDIPPNLIEVLLVPVLLVAVAFIGDGTNCCVLIHWRRHPGVMGVVCAKWGGRRLGLSKSC